MRTMNRKRKKGYSFTVIFEKDTQTGGYNVIVPALPGCFTQGETLEEAQVNVVDAVACHLGGLLKDGEVFSSSPSSDDLVGRIEIPAFLVNKTIEAGKRNKFLYA